MSRFSQRFGSYISDDGGSGGGGGIGGSFRQMSARSMSGIRAASQRASWALRGGKKGDDIVVDEDLENVPEAFFEVNKGNARKALQQVRRREETTSASSSAAVAAVISTLLVESFVWIFFYW